MGRRHLTVITGFLAATASFALGLAACTVTTSVSGTGVDGGNGGDAAVIGSGDAGAAGEGGGIAPLGDGGSGVTADGGVTLTGDAGSEPCGTPEAYPNDTRDTATPYALNAAFSGCIQTDTDVDFYQFTTPTAPVAGGYVLVQLTNVAVTTNLMMKVYPADNSELVSSYSVTEGANVYVYFASKPGATYRVDVEPFTAPSAPSAYTFGAVFTGTNDAYEPNDTREAATPITVGTPIKGSFLSGYSSTSMLGDADGDDWFKVTLAAGTTTTLTLSDVAADINGEIGLYDGNGSEVNDHYEITDGATVVLSQTDPIAAGIYYVRVRSFSGAAPNGTDPAIPAYFSRQYTLNVTQ